MRVAITNIAPIEDPYVPRQLAGQLSIAPSKRFRHYGRPIRALISVVPMA
jgi:hypothetical protein